MIGDHEQARFVEAAPRELQPALGKNLLIDKHQKTQRHPDRQQQDSGNSQSALLALQPERQQKSESVIGDAVIVLTLPPDEFGSERDPFIGV